MGSDIEQFFEHLSFELEKLAPIIEGSVSQGSYQFLPGGWLSLRAEFPGLKGTYCELPVWITFSITSDASQVRAGQPFGKPTINVVDYMNPYLQVHAYQSCPFTLRLTPERTDVMTKFTRLLRLESKGLQTGCPQFDDRYFLDCRSGREEADGFLRRSEVRDAIEGIGKFKLLRFEKTYIKVVTCVEEPRDYQSPRILGYLHTLSELTETLAPAEK